MKIYGKDYGFFMSVGATAKIAKECKDGMIENLYEIYDLPQGEQIEKVAKIICELIKAEEQRKYYEACGNYEIQTLSVDEVLSLPAKEFTAMQTEMLEAITNGVNREIETKTPKKEVAVPQSN